MKQDPHMKGEKKLLIALYTFPAFNGYTCFQQGLNNRKMVGISKQSAIEGAQARKNACSGGGGEAHPLRGAHFLLLH